MKHTAALDFIYRYSIYKPKVFCMLYGLKALAACGNPYIIETHPPHHTNTVNHISQAFFTFVMTQLGAVRLLSDGISPVQLGSSTIFLSLLVIRVISFTIL